LRIRVERRLPALSSFFGHRAGPGDQVSGGREAAHVAADFGEDDASAQLVDAGNGSQELDRGSKGLDLSIDLLIDLSDGCVNRVDMLEEKTRSMKR
jgi:hypothetical protein